MTSEQSPIQIVVGYDFSESARLALDRAIALTEREPDHVMHIVAVLDEKGGLGIKPSGKADYNTAEEVREMLISDIRSKLEAADPQGKIHFFVHVRLGAPAAEILELAKEVGAHLILVGSHGRSGFQRVLMGSVSEKVVREAKCPVLVIREREYADVKRTDVVPAPEGHAEERPYVKPHRYSYSNGMVQQQKSSWPWY